MKVVVKQGYTFNYHTSGVDVGGITNVSNPEGLIIDVDKVGEKYYVSIMINGIFIQIWCKSYGVERIGNERNNLSRK